jgi:uncharacterized protein YkwD
VLAFLPAILVALALPRAGVAQAATEDVELPADTAAVPADASPRPGPEARLHALVNRRRRQVGCLPLAWHSPSAAVAEARSADMIARRYFDHVTPDGHNVFDELNAAGIAARGSIAENIALTQAGAPAVLELWRDSPPHRKNLDNCAFTHEGIGERGGVWTQILLDQPKPVSRPAASPLR